MGLDSFLDDGSTGDVDIEEDNSEDEQTTSVSEKLKEAGDNFEAKVAFDATVTMEVEATSPEHIDEIAKENKTNVQNFINDELEAFKIVINPDHEVVQMDKK